MRSLRRVLGSARGAEKRLRAFEVNLDFSHFLGMNEVNTPLAVAKMAPKQKAAWREDTGRTSGAAPFWLAAPSQAPLFLSFWLFLFTVVFGRHFGAFLESVWLTFGVLFGHFLHIFDAFPCDLSKRHF